jgi:hypothetical protein
VRSRVSMFLRTPAEDDDRLPAEMPEMAGKSSPITSAAIKTAPQTGKDTSPSELRARF